MSEVPPPAAPRGAHTCTLLTDARISESVLFELARELQRLPVHSTLRLHVRALQLKRLTARWTEHNSDEASRHAVLGELHALRREVDAIRLEATSPRADVLAAG